MSKESGAGPERGGTHSGGVNAGGANSGSSSKGNSSSGKGGGRNDSGSSSPSPIGGASSYGMSEGSYASSIGSSSSGSGKGSSAGQYDSAFQNFRPDTPQNTQIMGGQMYVRNDSGNWTNYKTGQEVGNTQLDRLSAFDTLRQQNMMVRGYDDLTAVKNWFGSLNPFADKPTTPTTGISPLGGWASYGGAIPGQEDPRSLFDKLGDTFTKFGWGLQDAPLKTLASLASNPLVSTLGAVTGALPALAAIRGASAVADLATNVSTPAQAAQQLASTAIQTTPAGAALGEFKGVASAAVTGNPSGIAGSFAGLVGGKVGSALGSTLGAALSSNPYGASIGAMVGGSLLAGGASQLAASSSGQPAVTSADTKGTSKAQTKTSSPLLSKDDSGMVLASAPTAEADPLKYVREMKLPFYGQQYQLNQFGVPNTYITGV